MADISDVEAGLVSTVTSILYPVGSDQSSIVGSLCRIYRGWPNTATLNTDLAAGVINVTVTSHNESGRTTTRYLPAWQTEQRSPGTTATIDGETIQVGGAPTVGDVVGVLIGGIPYVYRVVEGDASDQIASNLAQMIRADQPIHVSGSLITTYDSKPVIVRVVCDAIGYLESRRQEKDVHLVCWCPDPTSRDSVAIAIDNAFSGLPFLALPDNTSARVCYKNTSIFDQAQNARLYRRDLIYTIEYPTLSVSDLPAMLFGVAAVNGSPNYG